MENYIQKFKEKLQSHLTKEKWLIQDLIELTNLTSKKSNEFHEAVRGQGILTLLITIYEKYQTSQEINYYSFTCFRNLCLSRETALLLSYHGLIEHCVSCLKEKLSSNKIVTVGLELLQNLVVERDNIYKLLSCEGVRVILNTIRYYSRSIEIQYRAIACLVSISSGSEDVVGEVVREGSHLVILRSLVNFQDNKQIFDSGLSLLYNISQSETHCVLLGGSKIIQWLCDQIKENPENDQMLIKCFSLLANLSCTAHNCNLVISSGGVQKAFEYLNVFVVDRETPVLIERIALLLHNITMSAKGRKEILIKNQNSGKVIVNSFKLCLPYPQTVFKFIKMLINISSEKENQKILVNRKIVPIILSALETYKDETSLVHLITDVITNLAFREKARIQIAQNGGTEIILSLIKRYASDKVILNSSLAAIMNLSTDQFNRELIQMKGGAGILQSVSQYHQDEDIIYTIDSTLKNLQIN
ncbi:protein aardvark [Anaeramoeba flamelloides]|uniref:Protein aardvark n=1 Tax=Anaeramoeba flamelloides TaxID=1746091 RepID=A0AAV7Z150_9EUKA|nr:protein aardvark [Anaeramoeba flamelloides]